MRKLLLTAIAVLISMTTTCSKVEKDQSYPAAERVQPAPAAHPAMIPRGDLEISDSAERRLRVQGLEGVDLKVSDGQVTLRGQVDSEAQKEMAEATVRNTPGVMGVSNQIIVQNKPINTNKPGGPQKNGNPNVNKPGGPSKHIEP